MLDRLFNHIDKQREEIVDFLKQLFSFDTSVNEGEAQLFISEYLYKQDLELDIFEPDNDRMKNYPDFGPGNDYEGKPNVVGILRGTGDGRSLILNAHIDTVSAEPVSSWKHDPFGGEIVGNSIYGRGAADDKGNLTAAVMAVKAVRETGISLGGDVILESVVGEETDGNGTLACCDRGYRADAAIVVDSVDAITRIIVAQAGVAYFRLKVTGRSAHLCQKYTREEGISAIDKIRLILDGLDSFQKERESLEDPDYYPKKPILGVTMISGGGVNSRSTFPEECLIEVEFDYFYSELDGRKNDQFIRKMIEDRIREIEKKDDWLRAHPSSIEWVAGILPTRIAREHPIVSTLAGSINRVAGKPELVPLATSTDARHFEHVAHTPVVSWGCGGSNAHGIDESLEIEDLINGTKILAAAITEWCGSK
jgi:acetylornithine deacetylase